MPSGFLTKVEAKKEEKTIEQPTVVATKNVKPVEDTQPTQKPKSTEQAKNAEPNPIERTVAEESSKQEAPKVAEFPTKSNLHKFPYYVKAKLDFVGQSTAELSFKKGEELTITLAATAGWLLAKAANGKVGHVPATFVEQISR